MAIAISNLEMYYIDIESSEKKEKSKNPVKRVATAIVENVVSVRRFVDDMRFNVITSEEELDNYVNANGNSWIINDK